MEEIFSNSLVESMKKSKAAERFRDSIYNFAKSGPKTKIRTKFFDPDEEEVEEDDTKL